MNIAKNINISLIFCMIISLNLFVSACLLEDFAVPQDSPDVYLDEAWKACQAVYKEDETLDYQEYLVYTFKQDDRRNGSFETYNETCYGDNAYERLTIKGTYEIFPRRRCPDASQTSTEFEACQISTFSSIKFTIGSVTQKLGSGIEYDITGQEGYADTDEQVVGIYVIRNELDLFLSINNDVVACYSGYENEKFKQMYSDFYTYINQPRYQFTTIRTDLDIHCFDLVEIDTDKQDILETLSMDETSFQTINQDLVDHLTTHYLPYPTHFDPLGEEVTILSTDACSDFTIDCSF